MSLAAPTHTSFRPVALTVAALAIASGSAFTAHAMLAGTPQGPHTPATATHGVTAPGYVPSIDGLNPVEREAALKLQRLRAADAKQFDCNAPGTPRHVC